MATKNRKRNRGVSAVSPKQQILRLLERNQFKQALKTARLAFRKKPDDDVRSLLEHAYIARAQQLIQTNQRDDARRIVQELRELGITEPAVQAALPETMLSIGLVDRVDEGTSDEERQRILIKMADQTVLHPELAPDAVPEIRNGSRAVREALVTLEQGDDSKAISIVKDFPRHSPFADWKLFVRGLAAYYRQDKDEMEANWNRLAADRPAARISRPLRVLLDGREVNDHRLRDQVRRLEHGLGGHAVVGSLARIQQAVDDDAWAEVRKMLRTVRGGLENLDGQLYDRLLATLAKKVVISGDLDDLKQLVRVGEGPPLDPCWNLTWAQMHESFDDFHDALPFWYRYYRDLDKVTALSPDARRIARGLVAFQIAMPTARHAHRLRNCSCGEDHTRDVERLETKALVAFGKCLKAIPTYSLCYAALAKFHHTAGREDEAVATFHKALQHNPQDVSLLRLITTHFIEYDTAYEGVEFAERALQERPLDTELRELAWVCRMSAGRKFAQENRIDEARRQLAIADQVDSERAGQYDSLAYKAMLEVRAGSSEAADAYIDQASEQLEELTAFWMAMAIESCRFGLNDEVQRSYEKRWTDALKKRCRSKTAGLMCKKMRALGNRKQTYSQWKRHVDILVEYVRRCIRVKWQSADLLEVCEFLLEIGELDLLKKYVKQGLRKCPDSAAFPAMLGLLEMYRGPWRCNRAKAADAFARAISLAESSSDSRDKEYADRAREQLVILRGHVGMYDHDDDEGDG